ncbi:MAG: hypothetical protein FJW39_22200 [Acidobacteria bacterium]|nr:hypothetical protein [Acidobacteriota bacterium]
MPVIPETPRLRTREWCLPPLILHPFSDSTGPGRLVESSRASLMLQGLLPQGDLTVDELERRLLDGRYCELRMLFYVGRDLFRWIEQCQDFVDSSAELRDRGYKFQSFASYVVENPPAGVAAKLKQWGVADYKAIFQRAIGLNCVLAEVPEREMLSNEFVRHYYRYADHMYLCRQHSTVFPELPASQFDFELFASGEYARMLEKEWEER